MLKIKKPSVFKVVICHKIYKLSMYIYVYMDTIYVYVIKC